MAAEVNLDEGRVDVNRFKLSCTDGRGTESEGRRTMERDRGILLDLDSLPGTGRKSIGMPLKCSEPLTREG